MVMSEYGGIPGRQLIRAGREDLVATYCDLCSRLYRAGKLHFEQICIIMHPECKENKCTAHVGLGGEKSSGESRPPLNVATASKIKPWWSK